MEKALEERLGVSAGQITDFCHRWHIQELALFGSILRDDFQPDSDVDVIVAFDQGAHPTLFDHVLMEQELEALCGRKVDLVSKRAVERSQNWLRRQGILSSARPIYVAK